MIWAIFAVIAVLLVLSSSIFVNSIMHSRKIKKSEQKFRTLFERVFDTLILFDREGKITDVNESAGFLLGYSRDEFRGLKMENLFSEPRMTELRAKLDQVVDGGYVYLGEYELTGNKGIKVHAELGCTSLEIQNEIHLLASLRDITDRKLAEEELRNKNIALREVLTSLEEEKLKIRKQISSTVDHFLMPSLERLTDGDGSVNMAYYKSLKENLRELASLSGDLSDVMAKLSPRELEISKLTRNNFTAKEIAKALNITVATVEKHKEKIRKKLKIYNTKINLAAHLQKINQNN